VDKLLAVHVSYGNNCEQAQASCARFREVLEHHKVRARQQGAAQQLAVAPGAGTRLCTWHVNTCTRNAQAPADDCSVQLVDVLSQSLPANWLQGAGAWEVFIHDHMDRNDTVADSLLSLAKVKQVDTLVLGISGYS
jgi:hypothetical protein